MPRTWPDDANEPSRIVDSTAAAAPENVGHIFEIAEPAVVDGHIGT